MTMPCVSIVIPTYNRKDLLIESVSSCINQIYRNIEIIIVDDGSTDNTDIIVNQMIQREWNQQNVRYIKKSNAGPASARQLGLESANGEYIQFLDSDDILFPDKIELQIEAIAGANRLIDCCYCYGIKGRADEGSEKAKRIGVKCMTNAECISALCAGPSFALHTMAPLWRRSFLKQAPGWPIDLICGEDVVYYARLLLLAKNIAFVEKELFFLRDHEGERATVGSYNERSRQKMISSLYAIRCLAEMVRQSNHWNSENKNGLIRMARTAYVLALKGCALHELHEYEHFALGLSGFPKRINLLSLVIIFRRLFGPKITLTVIDLFLNN